MKTTLHFPTGLVAFRECPSLVVPNQQVTVGGKWYYATQVWWDAEPQEMVYHVKLEAIRA